MIFSSRGCFKSTELSRIANQKLSKEYVSYLSDWSICHFFLKTTNQNTTFFLDESQHIHPHVNTNSTRNSRGFRLRFSDNVYPEGIIFCLSVVFLKQLRLIYVDIWTLWIRITNIYMRKWRVFYTMTKALCDLRCCTCL